MEFIDFSELDNMDKDEVKEKTSSVIKKIAKLHEIMHFQKKHSLLIILQGMDASGKDGLIKSVFEKIYLNGFEVKSFVKPTEIEYAHDFLWRCHLEMPAKGEIVVFNRSYYEDILVPSVEKYIDNSIIDQRFDLINNFEKIIEHNGTKIIKFYLDISKEEQLIRLKERIIDSTKHHKHNDNDWKTRSKWEDYINVYSKIFEKCNIIPWDIIPSNVNWQKEFFVAEKILSTLENMDIKLPEFDSNFSKDYFLKTNENIDSLP